MDLVRGFRDAHPPSERAFPEAEYLARLSRVRTAMGNAGLDLLLIHDIANICYLTGYQTPMADWYNCLLVPIEGELTLQACSVGLAVTHTDVERLVWAPWDGRESSVAQLVQMVRARSDEGRIGVEARSPSLTSHANEQLRSHLPRAEFQDATELVPRVRAVKSPAEVECLRQAARFTLAGMEAAVAAVRPGVSENHIAAVACEAMIEAGSEFFAIDPHVRAGWRSSMAHATYKRNRVKPGDPVILELGGVFQRYTTPMLRTVVVDEPTERLKQLADTCVQALSILYESIRPGRTMDEVAREAGQALRSLDPDLEAPHVHGYSVGIGFPPDWIEHSLFIRPGSQDVLEPGMTFHTPHSLRVPGVMAAGFSETIVVTETGCESLTQHVRDLIVV